ncbi:MAG TPA: DUF1467 family protein [Aestuariivirgaceae bacterium]|jgi:predicted secreted protein
MSVITLCAIYFIIWWLVLFAVLPWGATSAHESGIEVEPGHAPSAPIRPMMIRKLVATSIIAGAILAAGLWLFQAGILTLDGVAKAP